MPSITFAFPFPLNVSVQEGDVAYYCETTEIGNTSTSNTGISAAYATGQIQPQAHQHSDDIVQIGVVEQITDWDGTVSIVVCDWSPIPALSPFPNLNSFILFSKDNRANLSSLLGYYASFTFRNSSHKEAELFSIGAEVFKSSG